MLTALLVPAMLGAAALAVDVPVWLIEQHRLQIAADAAAYAASLELGNTAMHSNAPNSYVTLVQNEVTAVTGNQLIGTMATPQVSVSSGFTSITVTLSSTPNTYFSAAVKFTMPSITVTSTSSSVANGVACVLALDTSVSAALTVGGSAGSGIISATNCSVFADSSSSSAISLNSATITASSIGTHGGYTSTTATNTLSPTTINTGVPMAVNPDTIGTTETAAPASTFTSTTSCNTSLYNCYGNNYGSYGNYSFTTSTSKPGVFYNGATLGQNGSTVSFAPGIYYVLGTLTFSSFSSSNPALNGVTFVLTAPTGQQPGGITFTNGSEVTMTAPTSGSTAGYVIWQTCGSNSQPGSLTAGSISFGGSGNTLTASGAIYAPCGSVQIANGGSIQVSSGGTLSVVADTIFLSQGGTVKAAANNTSTTRTVALTN